MSEARRNVARAARSDLDFLLLLRLKGVVPQPLIDEIRGLPVLDADTPPGKTAGVAGVAGSAGVDGRQALDCGDGGDGLGGGDGDDGLGGGDGDDGLGGVDGLDGLVAHKLVRRWGGQLPGWKLTPAGRAHGERLLRTQLDAAGARHDLERLYRRFVPMNVAFLRLCQDWQIRTVGDTQRVNDHVDVRYDQRVVNRLRAQNDEVQELVAELAKHLDRFDHYGERFGNALANVESGLRDWFTRPAIDSFHTVWFELHEDLLATLGYERADERQG